MKFIQTKIIQQFLLSSIRTKMIALFLISAMLTSLTSLFVLGTLSELVEKTDQMFSANVELDEFLENLNLIDVYLSNYLVTDDSDSVLNYHIQKDLFREQAETMFKEAQDIYSENDLIYKDILYMVDSYLNEADTAVEARRLNDADEYIARYAEADKIASYIRAYVDRLNLSILNANTSQYLGMSESLDNLLIANLVLIIAVICLNIVVIFYMTYNMTKPIIKLANSAQELSTGNFESEDVLVQSEDEIKILASSFNDMKHSIKAYIDELHDKADTESKLLEQQIENLKIQSLLDEAELKALQAQINPHFLFNTLNAGVQLSMMEDAEKTSEFLENLAMIFRYNVNNLNRVVHLREEVEMVKAYAHLFSVRFGDRIQFLYNIDESVLHITVPPLIIQPFIENATIHGVGNLEQGGTITLTIQKDFQNIYITIEDDGIGIDDTLIRKLSNEEKLFDKTGHTTGIGISNVVQRLKLFFDAEEIIEIESKKNIGAKFTLIIPHDEDYQNEILKRGIK
jgi:sensor histidine kinase YesM